MAWTDPSIASVLARCAMWPDVLERYRDEARAWVPSYIGRAWERGDYRASTPEEMAQKAEKLIRCAMEGEAPCDCDMRRAAVWLELGGSA